jgi:transposase
LVGAEQHDERHKGKSDAYDLLGTLEAADDLFPTELDYKRLEFDRRRRDTRSFAPDLQREADVLVDAVLRDGRTDQTLAGIDVRAIAEQQGPVLAVHVAVSTDPAIGPLSGLEFRLTNERFLLLTESVREAFERRTGIALTDESYQSSRFAGSPGSARTFVVLTDAA